MEHMLMLHPANNATASDSSEQKEFITDIAYEEDQVSTDKPFIQANTIGSTLGTIKKDHIIPVFVKDNEPCISHYEFIETTASVVAHVYQGEHILHPAVRLSHPVKGRVPQAKDKPASQLLEHESTIYYERMAFVIEIPSVYDEIDGNRLSLCVGGVKAYNLDNLYARKGGDEHFKIFAGFQNKVCTNMCVWTDGTMIDLKVTSMGQLRACIQNLLENYNAQHHLFHLNEFSEYNLTEHQFAQLLGRCRMYQHLPQDLKKEIPQLMYGDQQLGTVVKDFYRDNSFCRMPDGSISLWRLYNLFTNANKATYIDQFIERGANAFSLVYHLKQAMKDKAFTWYLS